MTNPPTPSPTPEQIRFVSRAHFSMSGQFQHGRPLTVHFGLGKRPR